MKSILILYTSVGGNTALVVEKVQEIFNENSLQTTVKMVESLENFEEIHECDILVLASPTYGQGNVASRFLPFLEKLKNTDLQSKPVGVIGLGDVKYYPHYLTESVAILEEAVKTANGNLLAPSMRIGKNPIGVLDSMVKSWSERFVKKVSEL
jgi:flavodoxin I